jgi:hypothetical protein
VARLTVILILAACGGGGNSGIPPLPNGLTPANADPADAALETEWEALATALGIGFNQAPDQTTLTAQLATPSTYLTAQRATDYATLLANLSKLYASKAFGTRCAAIAGVQALGPAQTIDPVAGTAQPFPAANLYLMQYQLQADANGDPEASKRTGLLVIPASGTSNAVLAAYGHGGDFGLGYAEVASAFGQFQGNHVIIAPTFPGEPLCKVATSTASRSCDGSGALVPPTGTPLAYDTDVDELLGMYDCVVRASIGKLDAPIAPASGATGTTATLAATLTPLVSRIGGTGPQAQLPAGIIVGADRGGLVAELALAKTGAALSVLSQSSSSLGAAYLSPSYFSCAAVVAAPASFAFAQFRLFLEQWVKGRLAYTPFAEFPGMTSLSGLFDAFRSGQTDAPTAALAIVQRDAMLTSPLQIAALRDWAKFVPGQSPGGQGAFLMLNGVYAANPALVSATDPTKAPGLSLTQRELVPNAAYVSNGALTPGNLQHLDKSFFDGTSIVTGDFISSTVTSQAIPVAAAEAAAQGLAQQVFGAAPSAAQVALARAFVLSGVLQQSTPPTATSAGLAETLTPVQALGLWRQGSCEGALH